MNITRYEFLGMDDDGGIISRAVDFYTDHPNRDKEELAIKVLKNEIRHLGFDPNDVCILRYINKPYDNWRTTTRSIN